MTSLQAPAPLAIIGIGCRYPGGAHSAAAFWQMICSGVDAVTEVPPTRWDASSIYDPDPSAPNKTNTRWGGFLEQVDEFDPLFFGIAPREVATMDPQQRLLLEVAWETLEDAGQIPERLRGSKTGVFIGIGTHDYSIMMWQQPVNDPYATTGTGNCIAANRMSYLFDFKGPSLAVDTACSSSLVAVHLACQSLWAGESEMALVGGVNVMLLPTVTAGFSKGGFMSGRGRCQSFSSNADGYVRSEGAGLVLLKPLSKAEADGDRVYAVIRGSAVNQDGFSQGMAAPSATAQAEVLRAAYERAQIDPAQVTYVEAHGTGTKLGDPVEAQALGAVLSEGRAEDKPCLMGSVKTNFGHTETAAGVAGLIKAALMLKHGKIPPSLHCAEPNPGIDFERLGLRVQTELGELPHQTQPTYIGVNSFGFGGTNAHVVLADFQPSELVVTPVEPSAASKVAPQLLTLSAKSQAALRALVEDYRELLQLHPDLNLVALCQATHQRRTHFSHRLTAVAASNTQLQDQLQAWLQGEDSLGVLTGRPSGQSSPQVDDGVAFLFTGQGSQRLAMGQVLYQTQPVFRQALDRCAVLLDAEGLSLHALIYPEQATEQAAEQLNQTIHTQPALFAVEYALAQLWLSWGIRPGVLMGHSLGEYVAACVAGVFSLEDGLKLIAARGRLMQALPAGGQMLSVRASEDQAQALLQGFDPGDVAIAALNGPMSTVLSGKAPAIAQLATTCEQQGIQSKQLQVSHAFHSPLMEPMLGEFRAVAEIVAFQAPTIPMISMVTGAEISDEIATADYWVNHVRQPVRFLAAMETLYGRGNRVFLELGAKSILLAMGRRCLPQSEGLYWLPSLRPEQPDQSVLLTSLAQLYNQGATIDWTTLDGQVAMGRATATISLPSYPFQRQRYWWPAIAMPAVMEPLSGAAQAPTSTTVSTSTTAGVTVEAPGILPGMIFTGHPLLGHQLSLAGTLQQYFQVQITANSPTYLADHCVLEQPILPGAAYVEMLLAAACRWGQDAGVSLSQFVIEQPLRLGNSAIANLQLVLTPQAEDGAHGATATLEIFKQGEAGTTEMARHATAIAQVASQIATPLPELPAWQMALLSHPVAVETYYQQLADQGLNYGPHFRCIQQLWQQDGKALSQIRQLSSGVSDTNGASVGGADSGQEAYRLHPALLDACFQTIGAILQRTGQAPGQAELGTYLPVGLEQLEFQQPLGLSGWCGVALRSSPESSASSSHGARPPAQLKADLTLWDETGAVAAQIIGMTLQYVAPAGLQRLLGESMEQQPSRQSPPGWRYELAWQLQPGSEEPAAIAPLSEAWLVFTDRGALAEPLVEALRERGDRCFTIQKSAELLPYQGLSPDQPYHLNPASPEAFQQFLMDLIPILVAEQQGQLNCRILYLWPLDAGRLEIGKDELKQVQQICEPLLHLLQAISQFPALTARLWLVTQMAQAVESPAPLQLHQASLWGLAQSLRLEQPDLHCTTIDLPGADLLGAESLEADPASFLDLLLTDLRSPGPEPQIAYRQGERFVARLQPQGSAEAQLTIPEGESFRLGLSSYGLFENLLLMPSVRRSPQADEVEIQVRTSGLNFRDVLNALGMLQSVAESMGYATAADVPFGGECAGVITAVGDHASGFEVGDEVIAAQAVGSLNQFMTLPAAFVVPKLPSITFAEAATLPTAFLTAHYGLLKLAQLKAGDRVLIHAAAGGVGQAAVQVAQSVGAEVFATASPSKWPVLRCMGVHHLFNSRTLDFADEILASVGPAMDVVFNSLNGEVIPANLRVLAPQGRFVEIGKIDIWSTAQMEAARPDASYFPFDLLEISIADPQKIAKMLAELMPQFASGALKPLPNNVFPIETAPAAFRYMAQARHIGKVVLTLPTIAPEQPLITGEGAYLITGGLGALGLQLAQWLADQGAKQLLLLGRSAPTPTAQTAIQALEQNGVTVQVLQGDVADFTALKTALAPVLDDIRQPALKGLFHLAGCIDDGLVLNQSWERFAGVLKPKLLGAWNLHQLTQTQNLDHFVCFSSIASLMGSLGQTNYAAANGFLDALAQHRHALGQPALSLNWGPWASGMAAELDAQAQSRMAAQGVSLIEPEVGFFQLQQAMAPLAPAQLGILPIDWARFMASPGVAEMPLLAALKPALSEVVEATSAASAHSVVQELAQSTVGDRLDILITYLQTQLSQVMGFARPDAIDPSEVFSDLGMDSLMAVEFSNRLQTGLGQPIPQTLVFDYPTLRAMAGYLNKKLANAAPEVATQPQPQPSSLIQAPSPGTTEPVRSVSPASNPNLVQASAGQASAGQVFAGQLSAGQVSAQPSLTAAPQPTRPLGQPQAPQAQAPPSALPATPGRTAPVAAQNGRDFTAGSAPIANPPSSAEPYEPPAAHCQFSQMADYQRLKADLQRVEELGNPFFTLHQGTARDVVQTDGRSLISYASYNYLGLSGDPKVNQAAQAAIAEYGTSVSASRVSSGERPIHRQLEQGLAQFLGSEDCIVYIGGHATNVTTIGHLFNQKDLILYDALSHNSIREGCNLSEATAMEFPHNDWQTLDQLLQKHRRHYEKVLVAIEGVYSTDGDLAPLPDFIRIKQIHSAFLMVDEAHSIGVVGAGGRGIGEHFGVDPKTVDLWMGTLSKSFASCGGYIAGCAELVQYLKYTAPGFVFSVGMSPANAGAALAALQIILQEPERVALVQARSRLFLHLAQEKGLNTGDSHDSPVIPIIVGEPYKAVQLSQVLFQRGINVQPMVFPSVPYDASRLRFFVSCLHSEKQIRQTVAMVADELMIINAAQPL